MSLVQEKNELEFMPLKDDGSNEWVSLRKANVKKGTPGRLGEGEDWPSKTMDNAVFYNSLPPGSDITDQELSDIRRQELMGPMGNGTQVTNDLTAESVRKGFDRKPMSPTDDMYTNEHVDAFYGEGKSDGDVGFMERNNYLDRL